MMKKILSFFIFACLAVSWISYAQDVIDEELVLIVGETRAIKAFSPKKVVIVNPTIADVASASKEEIVVVGSAKGRTDLFFWDTYGPHGYRITVVPEDIEYIHTQVTNIIDALGFRQIYTRPIIEEGKVLLLGKVRTNAEKERLIKALGTNLEVKTVDLIQVEEGELIEISVEVLELAKDATKTLGFTYPGSLALGETNSAILGGTGYVDNILFNRNIFNISPYKRTALGIKFDMLTQEGKARILSRPKLVCQSGKKAELLVGGEVPILTTEVSSAGGSGTDVEYKDYGINLKISPTVSEDKRVKLDLDIDISEIGDAEILGDIDQPTAKAFPLTRRTVSTQLYLENGQTLSIGGLIKQKSEEDLRKFPWLSDIPVLGAFFRQSLTRTGGGRGELGDSELFIMLTPRVIEHVAQPVDWSDTESQQDFSSVPAAAITPVPGEFQEYVLAIKRKIVQSAYYPSVLLGTGWEGSVTLALTILETGELKDVLVAKSSGYQIFDEEAVKVARSLSFPMFPPEVTLEEVTLEVPIVYRAQE